MKEYVIITDSTTDLSADYIKAHNLEIIPIYYSIDDRVYGGNVELPAEEFYDKMRNGLMPTTMAANPAAVEKALCKYLDQGIDVLYIAFSSGLSGSYGTAAVTARNLADDYPECKIKVIDSLCASLGEGLIVHKALGLKEAGKSMDEVAEWLEKYKLNLCHQFTVDDLYHLYRGGRVSKATAVVGTIINVKPVLHVDNEGKLIPVKNVRGRKKALHTLVDHMEESMGAFREHNDVVFISHGDCYDDARAVGDMITERFGIKEIYISMIGPTIGAHSGPGTVALFFMGETR